MARIIGRTGDPECDAVADAIVSKHLVTADVQRELAEALTAVWEAEVGESLDDLDVFVETRNTYVAALLPTVQALIADAEKRAAARALRDAALGAAVVHPDQGWCVPTYTLNDLADALEFP